MGRACTPIVSVKRPIFANEEGGDVRPAALQYSATATMAPRSPERSRAGGNHHVAQAEFPVHTEVDGEHENGNDRGDGPLGQHAQTNAHISTRNRRRRDG